MGNRRARTPRKRAVAAYTLPRQTRHVRDLRPANDNPEPVARFIERTVVWLVPLMAFGLFALVVMSAN